MWHWALRWDNQKSPSKRKNNVKIKGPIILAIACMRILPNPMALSFQSRHARQCI